MAFKENRKVKLIESEVWRLEANQYAEIIDKTELEEDSKGRKWYVVEYVRYDQRPYERIIVDKIRGRYSQDDECAILRKKLAGLDSSEFSEYNQYVEKVKKEAKAFVEERDALIQSKLSENAEEGLE